MRKYMAIAKAAMGAACARRSSQVYDILDGSELEHRAIGKVVRPVEINGDVILYLQLRMQTGNVVPDLDDGVENDGDAIFQGTVVST